MALGSKAYRMRVDETEAEPAQRAFLMLLNNYSEVPHILETRSSRGQGTVSEFTSALAPFKAALH